jgi:hypothetical protein
MLPMLKWWKFNKHHYMKQDKNKMTLARYVPDSSLDDIYQIIVQNHIQLNIKQARSTKLGDFRPPTAVQSARLSINSNLNPYAFLITLVHEIAHWLVWQNYQNYQRLAPHGLEWKRTFKGLLNPFLNSKVFPQDVLVPLQKHMHNPKASSSSDIPLQRALKKYDKGEEAIILSDLSVEDAFELKGRKFKIIKKNRSRFLCRELHTGTDYLIHSLAEIIPLK